MSITSEEFEKMQPLSSSNTGERITRYWPGKASEREEGDIVSGEYIGNVTFGSGDDQATLYKLRDNGQNASDTEIIGVRESAVIKTAFDTIVPGMRVAIRYNGKRTGKNGRQYNDFEVRCLPPDNKEEETVDLTEIPFD
jgi:hypothetical protein